MCSRRKALIFSSASAVVLFTVALVAVFARPSSSSEDQYDYTEERSPFEDEILEVDQQDESIYKDKSGEPFSWQRIKLPSNIKPVHYRVYLRPDLSSFEFYGNVKILIKCMENTRTIHFHTRDLQIMRHHVYTLPEKDDWHESFEELQKATNSGRESEKLQMFAVELKNELQEGEYYIVYVEFKSSLSNGLSGFYKSSYKTKTGDIRYLATTHFEPTDARRAFPCFDEPALKANFSIIIVHHSNYSALSNMPIAKTVKLKNGLVEDHFATSVKMSTYLVAFVVCDFKYKESFTKSPKIRVRVWAPEDQINQADFAVGAAVKVLTFYQDYFKVPFPLPKMDLIAIPDFSAGAMENWGLITYRLTSLLFEPNESSSSNKQWVAVVVAHELAHQWFGNLVTMKWWNDLWLNEGFASYVEYVGADVVAPAWKMLDQFIVSDLETALELDQLSNSHPVSVPVHDPAQINELFDSISYDKGASIIRMLKNFLGDNVFLHGLQQYLKKHSFGNAETKDLWQSFTNSSVLHSLKSKNENSVNVTAVMETWTLQMGFPLITLTRNGKNVIATQRHFLVNPKAMKPSVDYKWKVPLTFHTDVDSTKRLKWMDNGKDSSVRFAIPENAGWIKANCDQYGYYRVNYDLDNWKKLIKQMQENHEALTAADRAGLLDDIFSLARSGDVNESLALDMTLYLTKEMDYVPYVTATSNLAYISSQLSYSPDDYTLYKNYIRQQVRPAAQRLGWEDKGTHLEKYLRTQVLSQACYADDESTIAGVLKMFKDWKYHNKKIPPNLRSLVYATGIKKGNKEDWDFMFRKYMTETVASEKKKLMYALTSSEDKSILQRYLSYSLDLSKVRSQDSTYVINAIARNHYGHQLAWKFFKDNYNELFKRYGRASFDFGRLIKAVTAHFNTEKMKREVKEFFQGRNKGSGTRAVQQSLESIESNILWVKKNKEEVVRWLKAHTAGSVSPGKERDE